MDGGVDGGATWTSKYGSVGCSVIGYAKQYGFDYVDDGDSDGLKEKGLAAHLLYLEETVYPKPDDRPAVSYLRWVRYVLDNFATVEEAVAGMKTIRIAPVKLIGRVLGTHLAIEDPSGDSAIFEYIDGNLAIRRSWVKYQRRLSRSRSNSAAQTSVTPQFPQADKADAHLSPCMRPVPGMPHDLEGRQGRSDVVLSPVPSAIPQRR